MTTNFKFLSMLLLALIVFSSCSKSPEEKAKVLAESEIKKSLIFPESYSLADIKTDSAFSPVDSPEFIDLCIDITNLAGEIDQVKRENEAANTLSSIWSNSYQDYSNNPSNVAKTQLNAGLEKEKQLQAQAKEMVEKFTKMMAKKREFIGYKSQVSYRAKNNGGNVIIDKVFMIVDKDVKNVNYVCEGVKYDFYKSILESIPKSNFAK